MKKNPTRTILSTLREIRLWGREIRQYGKIIIDYIEFKREERNKQLENAEKILDDENK